MASKIGEVLTIVEAFRLAIDEAKKGSGFVASNPLVGCVFLGRNNELVSVGYHRRYGQAHAEVDAHRQIDDVEKIRGGKAVVTLEPCAHFGKTPPCADLLRDLPLSEVHYGLLDPNPLVSGKGLEKIRSAGIKVIEAPEELKIELEGLAEIFLNQQRHKEPFVAVKVAASLDGQMCLANGRSQWVTGLLAREQGQRLRAHYGSVLSSAVTIMADNAQLNSRVEPFTDKKIPVFVIDDRGVSADFLPGSKLMAVREAKDVWIFTTRENAKRFSFLPETQVIAVDAQDEGLNLKQVIRKIGALGFSSVMVEAGPRLTSAFVAQGIFHRLELFIAPKVLGSSDRGSWTKGLAPHAMDEVMTFIGNSTRILGQDQWISARNPKSFHGLGL